MLYQLIILLGVLGFSLLTCGPKQQCFTDLASVTEDPVRIDTAIVFDPVTFEESCTRTKYYLNEEVTPDSVLTLGETVVSLVKAESCYRLLSIKEVYGPCQ